MHIATAAASPAVHYRERLSPSLWTLLSAAVIAPMVALVFVPLDATVALLAGLAAAALIVTLLVRASPVVSVVRGELRVGRAHIPVSELGEPVGLAAEQARAARGPDLSRTAWHLLRGGIDPVVRVPVTDPGDPVTEWVFSTRTPDRVIAAIQRAQRDAGRR
ncbi:DUF3093 domain-containing protein [Microbacterium aurum]